MSSKFSSDSLHDINNQANNHQRPDQSVSKHRCLLPCDLRLSMECGGKGSFQTVKLQRPSRTTVCSHPYEGHGPPRSTKSSSIMMIFSINVCPVVNIYERRRPFIVESRALTMNFRGVRWSIALISMEAFAVTPGIGVKSPGPPGGHFP